MNASASKLFTYLFYTWRKYDVTVTLMTLMSCDSVCCMCGEVSSSHWLMTQLTNDQHSCVLVFVPVVDILNIPCDCKFVFSALYEFYVSHHANILTVLYKTMKCDVSFSRGSVGLSTLFRWGEHVFHMCVQIFFLFTAVQKLYKNSSGDEIANVNFDFYAVRPEATRIRWNNAK